jgi:hypothetical protein
MGRDQFDWGVIVISETNDEFYHLVARPDHGRPEQARVRSGRDIFIALYFAAWPWQWPGTKLPFA